MWECYGFAPRRLPPPNDYRSSSSKVATYFLAVHILFEDGLQLAMYAIISSSVTHSAREDLGTIPIYMGMLQGIGFFLYKTQELFRTNPLDGAAAYMA